MALSPARVLTTPGYYHHSLIRFDASTQGVGGVLFQKTDEGDEQPISCMSSKLNSAQKNYNIT